MVPLALQRRVVFGCRLRCNWLRDQPMWLHERPLDAQVAGYERQVCAFEKALADGDGLSRKEFHEAHWIDSSLCSIANQLVFGMWTKVVDTATQQCAKYPVEEAAEPAKPMLAICDAVPAEVAQVVTDPKQLPAKTMPMRAKDKPLRKMAEARAKTDPNRHCRAKQLGVPLQPLGPPPSSNKREAPMPPMPPGPPPNKQQAQMAPLPPGPPPKVPRYLLQMRK